MTARRLIGTSLPYRTKRWRGIEIIMDQEPRLGTGAPAPVMTPANKGTTT